MPKGRKNGCPVNIKQWLVQVKNASEPETEFKRVYGLESVSLSVDSDTEEGSTSADAWAEPYITKRSASLSLEGKPVCVAVTGETDPGQNVLKQAALKVGCDGDVTLRLTDPFGHAFQADYIVTSCNTDADDSESSISWDLEQVGAAEILPYVPVSSVQIESLGSVVSEIEMDIADAARVFSVNVLPANASNKRFRLHVSKRSIIHVGNVEEDSFTIRPLLVGTSVVRVETVNGAQSAAVTVSIVRKSRPYETAILGTGILGAMVLGRSSYDVDD